MTEQCSAPVSAGQQDVSDDEVAVPMCAQEHERYCPTPPHPTGN